MSGVQFDTHEVVKGLKAAGFNDEQAEAVTRVVRDARMVDLSNLATKADLFTINAELTAFATKSDLFATKADLSAIKAELTALATKSDLFATKAELIETKAEIIKWMVSTMGVQTIVIISAVIALVRMGAH
jgi:hypothetical protein